MAKDDEGRKTTDDRLATRDERPSAFPRNRMATWLGVSSLTQVPIYSMMLKTETGPWHQSNADASRV
ncbi:MAG: hypothetical protein PVG71_12260 [Anaerolineae bacterium]|jgi:hypothetical protein